MSSNLAELPLVRRDENKTSVSVQSDTGNIMRSHTLKFFVLSVINLFIGTLLGVLQTFPGIAQWIRESGPAGHLIDPLAHAHINLVGGVTVGMMGLFYYVLPKLIERPIYSTTLATMSFWFSMLGVFVFFTSLVILGIIEGNMIHSGMTYGQALEAVGPIHHIMIISGAMLMGFGYWTYITNILLTVFKRDRGDNNASHN